MFAAHARSKTSAIPQRTSPLRGRSMLRRLNGPVAHTVKQSVKAKLGSKVVASPPAKPIKEAKSVRAPTAALSMQYNGPSAPT